MTAQVMACQSSLLPSGTRWSGANRTTAPASCLNSGRPVPRSFPGQHCAQGFLAAPGDVGDPPTRPELDEVEDDGGLFVQVLERDRRARLVGCGIADRDIDGVDLEILGIDEGIAVERSDVAALGRLLRSLTMSAASLGSK
jgi:hypothetical protein